MPANAMKSSTGARLVDVEGRVLPLRGTELAVRAGGGFARVSLTQRFKNVYQEALRVRYQLPLPADGAVAGFAFVLGGERTVGVVKPREVARADFERALLAGRSAALLEEDRSSLFNEEVGNIPPGEEVEVEVSVDQPLSWLPEGRWCWRFPTVVGPRYLGEPGRVKDADRVEVEVASGEIDARATLDLQIEDRWAGIPSSPVHALKDVGGTFGFQAEAVVLDRDVVVEWPVARLEPGAQILVGRPPKDHVKANEAFALLTVIPPRAPEASVPRDLIFLIDVSGSMSGKPLDQAGKVLRALVERLGPADQLEMVAFSNRPTRWNEKPVSMGPRGQQEALKWITSLRAGGGTEMRAGIEAALSPLRAGALRQVIVVTDGYIGFESEIVGVVQERLPRSCRVHILGVGQGVNRSLTQPLARVGCGTELIVAPGEDAERHAGRLLAVTDAPQITELEVSGSAVLELGRSRLPDLYARSPARIWLRLRPEGGTLELVGRSAEGPWHTTLSVPERAPGEGPAMTATGFARERVEDLEAARAIGGADQKGLDAAVERFGVEYQISTPRTSWIAVRPGAATVDPSEPSRAETMPHELVADLCAEGVGLRHSVTKPRRVGAIDPSKLAATLALSPLPGTIGSGARRMSQLRERPRRVEPARFLAEVDFLSALEEPEPTGGFTEPKDLGGAPPLPRLRAAVQLAENGRVVLSVEIFEDVEWSRPSEVTVVLSDGTSRKVELEIELSPKAGTLSRGLVIRLGLKMDEVPVEVLTPGFVVDVKPQD